MSLVMIRCPVTGRPVSTAIEAEPAVFRRLPRVAGRMRCPACGQDHVWNVGAAWLADAPHPVEPAKRNATERNAAA